MTVNPLTRWRQGISFTNRRMNKDITEEADIRKLVYTFYDKVRADDLLGPIFNGIIQDRWDQHLQTMVSFWSTLLLYTRTYKDDPMPKHRKLPVTQVHFNRWLHLFNQTLADHFEGPIAANASKRAQSIAKIMLALKD